MKTSTKYFCISLLFQAIAIFIVIQTKDNFNPIIGLIVLILTFGAFMNGIFGIMNFGVKGEKK